MKARTVGWATVVLLLVMVAILHFGHKNGNRDHASDAQSQPAPEGPSPSGSLKMYPSGPRDGIMSTVTNFTVVFLDGEDAAADRAYRLAEQALRKVEALCSAHLDSSDIGAINRAPAGEVVHISPETRAVLEASAQAVTDSAGAFDVTFAPLFRMWAAAGRADRLPTDADIAATRAKCGWAHFQLTLDGVVKNIEGAMIDLGGIAKGYGVDQAVQAMLTAGCKGGLVEAGGDLRVFGRKPDGSPWILGVRDPFARDPGAVPGATPPTIGTVSLHDGAVCTSGNYLRFAEIQGRRYSHILDPRTGRPSDANPSVTVVAPTAIIADIWATALSVLGPEGLSLLPDDIEAMVLVGGPTDCTAHMTDGFREIFKFDAAHRNIRVAP